MQRSFLQRISVLLCVSESQTSSIILTAIWSNHLLAADLKWPQCGFLLPSLCLFGAADSYSYGWIKQSLIFLSYVNSFNQLLLLLHTFQNVSSESVHIYLIYHMRVVVNTCRLGFKHNLKNCQSNFISFSGIKIPTRSKIPANRHQTSPFDFISDSQIYSL